ncbi:MAG: V-type ATP synthase subunit E [Candidatus Parvarchaeota archaeon]|nr:V-type ATP synthase subunit E [Candidatus Parvarchaeota archaeon]
MGLEEIEKHIRQEEKESIRNILSEAKKKYYTALADSTKKVEKIRSDSHDKIKHEADLLLDTEVNAAKADAEKRYNTIMESKLTDAYKSLQTVIVEFVAKEQYKKLLFELIEKASKELNPDSVFYVNQRDVKIVQEKLPKLRIVAADNEFIGGVKGSSKDGLLVVDFSLEEMLRRKKSVLIERISECISG